MSNEIACVILNYNNYEDTIKCVDNIIGMNCKTDIVVPDNNSTDESFDVLKKEYKNSEQVFVIRNDKNAGYSAGNNFGIKYILKKNDNIKYICIMNPDTLFDNPNLLEKLKDKMVEHHDIAVIAPVMYAKGEYALNKTYWELPNNKDFLKRLFINYKWKQTNSLEHIDDSLAYADAVHGSFFMIRRDVLEKMGFFDENIFLYSEENAIAFAIKKLGMREALCLDETYNHNHAEKKQRSSLKKKLNSVKVGNRSRLYICKKYYPKYLYPLARISMFLNSGLIITKHAAGSIVRRRNRS